MRVLSIVLSLLMASPLLSQSLGELQYAAYLKASKSLWQKSVDRASEKHGAKSFERALALYGLLNATMVSKDEDTFDEHLDEATDLLKEIIQDQPDHAEAHALLSATYGLVMAYSPMKGIFLGSKSSSLIERAVSLDPGSALVQKLFAGYKFHTPSMFGGDEQEAVRAFERSVRLFEEGNTENNWLYADVLVWLALSYKKVDRQAEAMQTLEKAIAYEPDFYWAKSLMANKS